MTQPSSKRLVTEAALADPASPPGKTLLAAVSGTPSYVDPTHTRRFDAANSVYGATADNLRLTRTRLAAARSATGFAKILCLGHSMVAGTGAGPDKSVTWPGVLRSVLAQRGYPQAGNGWCYAMDSDTGNNTRWSRGSWAAPSNVTAYIRSTVAGQTATFTSDGPGTVVDIMTFGSSAAFTYTIDGGATRTWTPNGADAVQVITVTGLPNTTHTVAFTSVAVTGSVENRVVAVQVRAATSGVLVTQAGMAGSLLSHWTPTTFNWIGPTAIATDPDLTLIELDTNELLNGGVQLSTFVANMRTLITRYLATGDVALVISPPTTATTISTITGVPLATQQTWADARYGLADEYGIPLVDFVHTFKSYEVSNPLGTHFDPIHPGPVGYALMGRAAAYLVGA